MVKENNALGTDPAPKHQIEKTWQKP